VAAHHVFAYAALPDVDAEFEQFAVDAGCTPTGILAAPPADQSADLTRNDRPSRLAAAHLLGPEQAKAGTMPGHDRHSEIVLGRPHVAYFVPGPVSLDQSTELVGSGTVNGGHVTVSVTGFTVRGENYGLR
jgi:hypothetical protein